MICILNYNTKQKNSSFLALNDVKSEAADKTASAKERRTWRRNCELWTVISTSLLILRPKYFVRSETMVQILFKPKSFFDWSSPLSIKIQSLDTEPDLLHYWITLFNDTSRCLSKTGRNFTTPTVILFWEESPSVVVLMFGKRLPLTAFC